MNLFDVEEKYCSHPNYPYKYHVKNIADTFGNKFHKESASYHDLGKLCSVFQNYIDPNSKDKKKTIHALQGALLYLKMKNYHLDNKSFSVFNAILKHHGNLEDVNSIANDLNDSEEVLYRHTNLLHSIKEISEILNLDMDFDIEKCCKYFNFDDFVTEHELGGLDTHFKIKDIFSKLIFTDKYEAIFKSNYIERTFDGFDSYIEKLINFLSKKNNALSPVRNEARINVIKRLKENIDKNIFLLEAPTGIGKTFMALNVALEIVRDKKKKRIINALPMTSIIDQTFDEYSNIFDDNILMKYHHLSFSKKYCDKEKERQNEENCSKQKDSFICNSWSEDCVIITTFNQLLNLFYSNRNKDLIKFWTLRNSVVILDEIQAIPRILLRDFSETITFLSNEFNIDFILMSATIPDIKNLIDNSMMCELLDNKYFSLEFNNRYALSYRENLDSEDKLINEILINYEKKQSVLCVVNTKRLALSIYTALKKRLDGQFVFLLSSYFIPISRKNMIKCIKRKLKTDNVILISTQVIEAGVDLDFDIGFREFAPFYSIIQTAGRINRENRIEVRDSATLFVTPPIGGSPYHQTDLLEDIAVDLMSLPVRENCLLLLLKKYFRTALKRTSPDQLLKNKMENLEFENVIKTFNNIFMKQIPNLKPVFIEHQEGLYDQIIGELKRFYEDLNNKNIQLSSKMEIKEEIKNVYKRVSQYTINVPEKEIEILPLFFNDSDMRVCRFEILNDFYTDETGWLSKIEGSLFF